MSQTTLPSEDASQAATVSPARLPRLGRWLARALLGLWWAFIVALAVGIAQYLGNHAGPAIIPLLPQLLTWFWKQPLPEQIGLGALALVLLAVMGWLTILAWRYRQRQAAEEIEAGITRQARAFQGTLEQEVHPRLAGIQTTAFETQQTVSEVHAEVIDTQDTIDDVHAMTAETRDTVAGIHRTVAETHDDVRKLAQGEPLPLVRDLTPDLFKMGDPFAEKIEYYRKPPVENVFAATTAALKAAAALPGKHADALSAPSLDARRGIVVMGEANAGKSRLMFEALTATLPDWCALLWSEARTTAEIPPPGVLRDRDVVIILDDLHNFVSGGIKSQRTTLAIGPGGSGSGIAAPLATGLEAVLGELVRRVRTDARRTVIVATCRSEHKRATEAKLDWLLVDLTEVTVPRFSANAEDPQSADILAFFRTHRVADPQSEWDGTIGSAVLGLRKKRARYRSLVERRDPVATILHTMKLLTLSGVTEHTERRVRQVCADVFREQVLLDNEVAWQNAERDLLDLEFVQLMQQRGGNGGQVLVIRKDTYFDYVVTDYPDARIPGQLETARSRLLNVFTSLDDPVALSLLGAKLFDLQRFEEALAACDQELALTPRSGRIWTSRGAVLYRLDRYADALAALDRALELTPQNAVAWNNKGITLHQLQRYEEALAAFDRAVELDPEYGASWIARSGLLLELGRFEEALAASEKAVTFNPQNVGTWAGRGAALLGRGRYEEALAALDRALELAASSPEIWGGWAAEIWAGRGAALLGLHRDEEALEAYDQVLALDANSAFKAAAWHNKGDTFSWLGRYKEALAAYEEALILATKNAVALVGKGAVLFSLSRDEEALAAYEQALTLAPKNAGAWRTKGNILRELGRLDDALEAYEHAFALDPDSPWGWNYRAYVLAAMGRYEDALTSIERAIALAPDNANFFDSKGEILMMADRYDDALPCFEKAISLDPAFANSWNNLVVVYRKLGHEADAQVAERMVRELGG